MKGVDPVYHSAPQMCDSYEGVRRDDLALAGGCELTSDFRLQCRRSGESGLGPIGPSCGKAEFHQKKESGAGVVRDRPWLRADVVGVPVLPCVVHESDDATRRRCGICGRLERRAVDHFLVETAILLLLAFGRILLQNGRATGIS